MFFTVFSSITTFHVNSMTSAGQCRLSPLIPLIQDSSQLYDFLVRIMFKLHSNLPNDVLAGNHCANDNLMNEIILKKSFSMAQVIVIVFVRFSINLNHFIINHVIYSILLI